MEASFLGAAASRRSYPQVDLPRIAFAGRSNVGKSSLINSLLGRKNLARTSSRPGRTQAIHFYGIQNRWVFVDLPGYGFARAPKAVRERWGPMIEEFLTSDHRLALCVLIIDARHAPTALDLVMRDYLVHYEVLFQVVATKCDKLSANTRLQSVARAQQSLRVDSVLPYSSATGMGKRKLWRIIREVESWLK